MTLILDYGVGNLLSIGRLISTLGGEYSIGSTYRLIQNASRIILPGVGSFDHAMNSLKARGVIPLLCERVRNEGVPILGICLGMQLLCHGSEEGREKGLGLLDAEVIKFKFSEGQAYKIPHMGWNYVRPTKVSSMLPIIEERQRFYFAHSFYVRPASEDKIAGTTVYGSEFCSMIQSDNIWGVQFHPEKSHRFGSVLVRRFLGVT